MTTHASRCQIAIEPSPTVYHRSFPQRRPSFATRIAPQGLTRMNISSVSDSTPSFTDRLSSPTQQLKDPPVSMTDPPATWTAGFTSSNYHQETCNYQHSQELYHRYYEDLEVYPSHGTVADEPYWMYNLPPDYSLANPASTCPRSYPPDFLGSPAESMIPTVEAYPPAAYHLDPQKHQSYLNLANAPIPQKLSPLTQNIGSVAQMNSGSIFREDLYRHESPMTCHSSTPSYRIDNDSTISPPPVDGCEGMDMARFKDDDTDGECSVNEEPYAKLIWRALMSAPEHKMVLKEIYEWFELNTDKAKNSCSKGWQNSIRHNLSMNGAFKKVDQLPPCDESKKGFIWVLEPSAIQCGVKSTTRYRKTVPNKKGYRSENPAPQRQRSGAKGGKAARKAAKLRRSARNEALEGIQMIDQAAGGIMTNSHSTLHDCTRPATPLEVSDPSTNYSSYENPSLAHSQHMKQEPYEYQFEDIVGCVDPCHNEPLFCDGSADIEGSILTGYQMNNSMADPFFCSQEM